MRAKSLEAAVQLAQAEAGPIAAIVNKSIEIGVIFPSLLTANLKAAGYAINYRAGTGYGAWVLVTRDALTEYDDDNPTIVARAFSHDEPDALLQAVFAAMKEEAQLSSV